MKVASSTGFAQASITIPVGHRSATTVAHPAFPLTLFDKTASPADRYYYFRPVSRRPPSRV